MKEVIQVTYTCGTCDVVSQKVSVEARTDPNPEAVVEWMEMVGKKVAADHMIRRPRCQAERLAEIMIPLSDDTPIGGLPTSVKVDKSDLT